MSAFEVKLTAAGYAAFVNPDNTGTNAVRIASIGITAQAFAANAGTLALPGEIKRVSTIAGIAIADNIIHVTMIDTTADAYDLRGFAGYDEAGTLLFVYGDADAGNVIFQKSPLSYAGMSADIVFFDPIEAEVVFGDVSFINPPASETIPGVSRRATQQQHIDGAATDVTATPAGIKALLDTRFGNGAPSVFVKGLLNLATAVLFRAAIGVKDVATRDMGTGGGIDADMLDGKHASEFASSSHTHTIANVTGLQLALDAKAPLASPALSGTPTAPTPATADNSTRLATTAYVQTVIANLIASAPGALDTLNELAIALGNDPNFAATITNALALKAPLASPALSGAPTAPTAGPGTNTTQIASTAFVQAAIAAALANYLPKHNPTFTGTMTGPSYNEN